MSIEKSNLMIQYAEWWHATSGDFEIMTDAERLSAGEVASAFGLFRDAEGRNHFPGSADGEGNFEYHIWFCLLIAEALAT